MPHNSPQNFNGSNLFVSVLISILQRQDQQMIALDELTKKVDALSTVPQSNSSKKDQYITTGLALIVFAMLVLAIALKGCG